MKKLTTVAASAAIVASFAAGNVIAAENMTAGNPATENPFAMQQLTGGYIIAMSEGVCGEGKCGGDKGKEAKCGEGKCGDDKAKEAKCGEGKCGASK